jgi:hypothetical protein
MALLRCAPIVSDVSCMTIAPASLATLAVASEDPFSATITSAAQPTEQMH